MMAFLLDLAVLVTVAIVQVTLAPEFRYTAIFLISYVVGRVLSKTL